MTDFLVIFGAAVRPDGSPSGTMRRRVDGALLTASTLGEVVYLPSGAKGRYGDAEAALMSDMLIEAGVDRAAILPDADSFDTFDTVLNCAAMLERRAKAGDTIHVCTSRYHMPRCRWLFRMIGLGTRAGRLPPDRPAMPRQKLLYLYLREIPAFVWDTMLMAARLLTRRVRRVRLANGRTGGNSRA